MYIEARYTQDGILRVMRIDDTYPGYFVYEDDDKEIFEDMSAVSMSRRKGEERSIYIKTRLDSILLLFKDKNEQIETFDKLVKLGARA